MFFFFAIFITVQIQHYCLYLDSPTLLPLVMPGLQRLQRFHYFLSYYAAIQLDLIISFYF